MKTDFIFTLLQHPLTIVILGSVMGWLIVNHIWLPYEKKYLAQNKTKPYKKEVLLRLIELKKSFENQYSITKITNILDGKTTLNPHYKFWKLDILIRQGWSDYAYKNTQETLIKLVKLVEESDTTIDKEKTKKGLLLIDTITIYLKNINEN